MNDELLNKYLSGNTTPEERIEVFEWIKFSQENEDKFNSLRKIQDFNIWRDPATSVKLKRNNRKFFSIVLQIAALFALFFGVYRLINPLSTSEKSVNNLNDVTLQSLSVPSGQNIEFTLEDGTKVWLNSNSTLRYPTSFSEKERIVELEGEGYFDVVSDISKPFIVKVSDYIVQVTGTEFNIKSYDYFEASLISGSVTVENIKTKNSINLNPYESVSVSNNTFIISPVNENDLLWRDGILSINDKTIDQIISILEQHYEVKFIFENKKYQKNKKYTGKFRIEDGVEQILQVLQIQNNISYEIRDSLIILN